MKTICGVDEAGRGPLIGPLVMCGVMIKDSDENKLINLKVKDSKLLTKEKREFLFDKVKDVSYKHKVVMANVDEVDRAVNGEDGLNLNWLEAVKTAEIINSLNPDKAIIDAPSNNIEKYKQYLMKLIKNKKIELVLEHKADIKYPVVSAASIIAKVIRDNEISKLKKKIKIDFGSGYPSDPKTIGFLEKYHKKHSEIFRKSWMPYKKITNKKFQRKLGDFSQFIKKVEDNHKDMVEKMKKLEDFEYEFIPTSTDYEHVRMKGPCTITLYKSGKLLIQGKKENKKFVEKILKNG